MRIRIKKIQCISLNYQKYKILSEFDIVCFTESHLTGAISMDVLKLEVFSENIHREDTLAHSSGLLVYVPH